MESQVSKCRYFNQESAKLLPKIWIPCRCVQNLVLSKGIFYNQEPYSISTILHTKSYSIFRLYRTCTGNPDFCVTPNLTNIFPCDGWVMSISRSHVDMIDPSSFRGEKSVYSWSSWYCEFKWTYWLAIDDGTNERHTLLVTGSMVQTLMYLGVD